MAKSKKSLKKKQNKKVKLNEKHPYEVKFHETELNTNFFIKFWNWLKSFV